MTNTQKDIIKKGYQALIDSLGVVDTIRFIQYFSPGQGDYTQDRHQWLEKMSLNDILLAMRQWEQNDNHQYDEIIGDEE
ncbi:hypothetical protein J0895_22665 [Phormidium pseudopriestleyi FRX01]|uniref:Uncharacterized protein n=1 Tax=Phormidium pseudopriestleyi FRX01 TaxID=1759528 RepID=A0ABS3FXJ4_9CYAN|nr:hypothetical protein [Phormidium pseudopriestleyi]MBO0351831.1 hypothetical protein [Phormidium pseudopriestleyi FRX01]